MERLITLWSGSSPSLDAFATQNHVTNLMSEGPHSSRLTYIRPPGTSRNQEWPLGLPS